PGRARRGALRSRSAGPGLVGSARCAFAGAGAGPGWPRPAAAGSPLIGAHWASRPRLQRPTMIPSGFHVQIADFRADHEALRAIRDPVFVDEQRVPPDIEADALDPECRHVLARDDAGRPIGTGRLTPDGRIGRLAVLREWRGRGVGAALLQALLALARDLRHPEVSLHAQVDAIGFYERFGFETQGEEFVEAGIRHRTMRLPLSPREPVLRPGPGPTPPARLLEASSLHDVRELLLAVLHDARHELMVLGRDLDSLLLAQPEAMEQLRRLACSGP